MHYIHFLKKKLILATIFLHFLITGTAQVKLYVAANGSDKNTGTLLAPFQTLQHAINLASQHTDKNVVIELRGAVYPLENPISITASPNTFQSLVIRPHKTEQVTLSGAKQYKLHWQPYKNGIVKASLDLAANPDRVFLNGKALQMARYPNFDSTARVFNGTAADALSDERVSTWINPSGAYVHALHSGEWGGFHYLVKGRDDDGKLLLEGGWQNNRPSPMHKEYRFVENIFEALDAPGEWYYDATAKLLYLYPPNGTAISKAQIAIGRLNELITINGDAAHPASNITIQNIRFTQTNRTFMLTKEPLLRSDWTIYRGGALLLDGTENITVSNCIFDELGGNAVFLSNFNKNNIIKDNHIFNIGASAVAFVGNPDAVRSPAFRYEQFVTWSEMDFTRGPKTNNYPQYCKAEGNLIHNIGTIEKQVAGVQIAMASHITVAHNTIYNVPRSGINIGDGCWGGHLLEHNDVFYTVLETGDHGAFNSWGRDRFWRPDRNIIDSIVEARPGIEGLDMISPNIIRNNRFQCDHGWDIDLDDGSSNYEIYNNVCLSGGLKLREGYHRRVFNNVIVNNTFHPHVWLKNSDDVFTHNIVTSPYAPILIEDWGSRIDSNFFLSKNALDASQALHLDASSRAGDPQFIDASKGDYRVKRSSPALLTGFKNFEMEFGVTLASLKIIAAKPPIRPLLTAKSTEKSDTVEWLGATLKNIETLGERSAAGLADDKGALIVDIKEGSVAYKNDLRKGDVIIKMGDDNISATTAVLQAYQKMKWMGRIECEIVRNQVVQKIQFNFNK